MKLRNRIFITVFGIVLCATGFQSFGAEEAPLSTAAGFYQADHQYLLILDNGITYNTYPEDGYTSTRIGFDVLENESAYLVSWSEDGKMLFVEQMESESPSDGGGYYAVYKDYIGRLGDNAYDAENQILFDDYIFSNEYGVCRKEPLSVFFGSDNSQYLEDETEGLETAVPDETLTAVETHHYESAGFSTPEEALGAYIKGLQNQDLSEMISAFAVETFVENFNFIGFLDRRSSYDIMSYNYIPYISELSGNINMQVRLRDISRFIRYQYLTLTNPDITSEENTRVSISLKSAGYETGIDFVKDFFVAEDSSVLSSIKVANGSIDPVILSEKYTRDSTQEYFQKQQITYGADAIQSVAAFIIVKNKRYILSADAVKYGDKWYLFSLDSYISRLLEGSVCRGGLLRIIDGAASSF